MVQPTKALLGASELRCLSHLLVRPCIVVRDVTNTRCSSPETSCGPLVDRLRARSPSLVTRRLAAAIGTSTPSLPPKTSDVAFSSTQTRQPAPKFCRHRHPCNSNSSIHGIAVLNGCRPLQKSVAEQSILHHMTQHQHRIQRCGERHLSLLGAAGIGVGSALLAANAAFLASAVPAVLGKGAPYLPTSEEDLSAVFDEALPPHLDRRRRRRTSEAVGSIVAGECEEESLEDASFAPSSSSSSSATNTVAEKRPITVVDLGSGDGRVAIAAAQRGHRAVGYEFNPILVAASRLWATWDARRFVARRRGRTGSRDEEDRGGDGHREYGSATFYCRDLWTVDLNDADVVFVYGLGPIMERLGDKILAEAPPDVIVVSNVFRLGGGRWRQVYEHRGGRVRLYVPSSSSFIVDDGDGGIFFPRSEEG